MRPLFDDHASLTKALDPLVGEIAWRHGKDPPAWSGTVSSAVGRWP